MFLTWLSLHEPVVNQKYRIYVGFPRLAQSGINDSSLEITALSVTNPTPTSVDIKLDSVVHSSSSYHPSLDAFNASLALAGAGAFGSILLPTLTSTGAAPVHVEQTLNITDEEAFETYNKALLGSQNLTQSISGRTWLHQGSLPATEVSYDKSVTMNGRLPATNFVTCRDFSALGLMLTETGLNNLAGFNITAFSLKPKADADGSNAEGTVFIPNPSVLTLELGNVTFANSVDGTLIGNSTLPSLVLKPGDNTVTMRAVADQNAVLPLVVGKYKDGKLPVTVTGESVIYNGQRLPYYEAALKASSQKVTLDVMSALRGANSG